MLRTPRPMTLGVTVAAAAATAVLTGCGAGSSTAPQTAPDAGSNAGSAGQGRNADRVGGKIAEIDGKTVQVQTRDAQTAVTYGSSTSFTQQLSAKASAVTSGVCVVVRSETAGSSGSATPSAGARPSLPSAVTATSVSVTAGTKGSCAVGLGGGDGGGGSVGSQAPGKQATPSEVPSGAPDDQGGRGGGPAGQGAPGGMRGTPPVTGRVTAVTDAGFTVAVEQPGGTDTRSVTVTTISATTYTKRAKASAEDLDVGQCLTATGKPDATGTVAATAISLQPAVDGSCTIAGRAR